MSSFDQMPSNDELVAARERGYASQAALNGIPPDSVVAHIPVYNRQCTERETRLTTMHDAIIADAKK